MMQLPFPASTYVARREEFMQKVNGGTFVFLGNDEVAYNYTDNIYPFRQDSSFLYYFGIQLPNIYGIIDAANGESILFADDVDINMLVWTGPQPTAMELAEMVGIRKVVSTKELPKYIKKDVGYLPPYRHKHVIELAELLDIPVSKVGAAFSTSMVEAIISQRSVKSQEELAQMDLAVDASEDLHLAVLKALKPGKYEYEMVAEAEKAVRRLNAGFSYTPIATIHGQVLHNHHYSHQMKSGQLFLLDAGAEVASAYAGDLTRTFPVNGKFSQQQKEIYEIVLAAQNGVIDALKPGVNYKDMHLLSAGIIFEGLKELGLMKGDKEAAVAAGAHALFFPHGLGHMIGLDVHDMENLGEDRVGYADGLIRSSQFGLRSLRLARKLDPGHVLTVEPGVYFIPALIDSWRASGTCKEFIAFENLDSYRDFGGIRIEDNFVITEQDKKRVGFNKLANKAEDIEVLMSA